MQSREENRNINILITAITLLYMFILLVFMLNSNKVISPDENNNYYFSNIYMNTGKLYSTEYMDVSTYIRPRLTCKSNEGYASAKFQGMLILWGGLGNILGENIIRFVTPILLLISSIMLFFTLKRVYSVKKARIGYIFCLFNPFIIYWTYLGMYEDIASLCFTLCALSMCVYSINGRRLFLAGLFLGMSILIKPFYFLLVPVLIITVITHEKKIFKKKYLYFVAGIAIPVSALLIINNELYGAPFVTGYNVQYKKDIVLPSNKENHLLKIIQQCLYLGELSIVFIIGITIGLTKIMQEKDRWKNFLVIGILLFTFSLMILAEYIPQIQSSYVRYTLTGSLFFSLLGIYLIIQSPYVKIKQTIISIIIVLSVLFTYKELVYQFTTRQKYEYYINKGWMAYLEKQKPVVVITTYWDKLLFPKYPVIVPSNFAYNYQEISKECKKIIDKKYNILLLKDKDIDMTLFAENLNKEGLAVVKLNTNFNQVVRYVK